MSIEAVEDMKEEVSSAPCTLTVVMLDDLITETAIVHENQWRPYGKRTVQIQLTEDQRAQLRPRHVGSSNGKERYEKIFDAWFEPEEEKPEKEQGSSVLVEHREAMQVWKEIQRRNPELK